MTTTTIQSDPAIPSTGTVKPFGMKDKLGYMFGDLGNDMSFALASTFLMVFYTNVLGVNAVIVGTILLSVRLIDAFVDVGIGVAVDRMKPHKDGKFRPWIKWMMVPVAVSSFLLYIPNLGQFSEPMKLGYIFLTYLLWSCCYSGVNIPYGSMAASLSPDPADRASLSVFRTLGGQSGNMAISLMVPFFIYYTTEGGTQGVNGFNFMITAAVLSGLSIIWYIPCYVMVTERVAPKPAPKDAKNSHGIGTMLKGLAQNKALASLIAAALCLLMAFMLSGALSSYLWLTHFQNGAMQGIAQTLSILPILAPARRHAAGQALREEGGLGGGDAVRRRGLPRAVLPEAAGRDRLHRRHPGRRAGPGVLQHLGVGVHRRHHRLPGGQDPRPRGRHHLRHLLDGPQDGPGAGRRPWRLGTRLGGLQLLAGPAEPAPEPRDDRRHLHAVHAGARRDVRGRRPRAAAVVPAVEEGGGGEHRDPGRAQRAVHGPRDRRVHRGRHAGHADHHHVGALRIRHGRDRSARRPGTRPALAQAGLHQRGDRGIGVRAREGERLHAAAAGFRPRGGQRLRYVAQRAKAIGDVARDNREIVTEEARVGGIILGRNGAFLLNDIPGSLHVKLVGPVEARVTRGAELAGISRERSARRQVAEDFTRREMSLQAYKFDPTGNEYYDLVIDTTRFSVDETVDMIKRAAATRQG